MDRLEAMTILLAAVDTGSLSAASRQLRIPLATVSRRISELEKHLNIRLLLRGSRGLVLTDAGRGYVASCRRIIDEIADVERTASGEYRMPQGELIISVPQVIGRIHVMPVVAEFLRAFPGIRVCVQISDRSVNLLEEHIDLGMRIGQLRDSSLIAVRVGFIRPVLCASPAYLKNREIPGSPFDLVSHDCVVFETVGNNWTFTIEGVPQSVQVSSRLMANSGDAVVAAVVAGAGIAQVLSHQIEDEVKSGALVRLLDGYENSPLPVSLIYPSQRQVPLKLRAFLDFSIPLFRKRLGYENA